MWKLSEIIDDLILWSIPMTAGSLAGFLKDFLVETNLKHVGGCLWVVVKVVEALV